MDKYKIVGLSLLLFEQLLTEQDSRQTKKFCFNHVYLQIFLKSLYVCFKTGP